MLIIDISNQMTPTIKYRRKSKKYLKFSWPTQLFIHAISKVKLKSVKVLTAVVVHAKHAFVAH